jgi:hypothetical protein
MVLDIQHRQSAHCENGATASLLNYYGLKLSEPMVFGIGSGLFFAYLPFIRLNGLPVVSFRPLPGAIFRRVTRQLGILTHQEEFRRPESAMRALDQNLEKGIPTGLLVGVFKLPYFPPEYRFHFNAHNIIVFGKENGKYLVSDSVMESVESMTYDELVRVRFAKGTYPPKGKMYYVSSVPESIDLNKAIRAGIRRNCRDMLSIPMPIVGVKGIKYLSGRLRQWPERLGEKRAAQHLGQVVRMLEEIGTGGAGFRFMYAAFLQEASEILGMSKLRELSEQMTSAGDRWRDFAFQSAKNLRARGNVHTPYPLLANLLLQIVTEEQSIFRSLAQMNL